MKKISTLAAVSEFTPSLSLMFFMPVLSFTGAYSKDINIESCASFAFPTRYGMLEDTQ